CLSADGADASEDGSGRGTPLVVSGVDLYNAAETPAVRRLTPRECERLQGFPDDWTLVDWRHGKPASDGPRYKAIGNSMAVPVLRWILTRLEAEKRRVDRRVKGRKA
ncbi:DNA cytosine methyltransferase, partial [bacterium]|nr:DNA cytosine methyltransferase [bacterium]